jgi:hypothetical protein
MQRFSLPIAELDAGLVDEVTSNKTGFPTEDDPPLTFAFNSEQGFQGDYSVAHSGFARIERIAASQVDLNGDGKLDYLVTAARHAAMAAVSNDGAVLWKRRLPMTFEIAEARSRYPKQGMTNEAIVGITPTDDLNNDGTPDLVVSAALFDPSGFSRPHIFTLSGSDGNELFVAPFPTVDMRKVQTWPWTGLLRHRRQFNSEFRSQRPINTHFELISMRSRAIDLYNDSWGGNSANSALYVLPPLILGKHEETRIAVTATDQAVHFVNLADGSAVGPAIPCAQPILRGPLRVQLADALANADSSYTYGGPPKRNQGFLLLKIDRIEGRLIWSQACYEGTNPQNAVRPADPIQVDLNGDDVTDLITGNINNGRMIVQAIDGRDGQAIWKFPLHLDADDWPWREPWPMMTLVASGSQDYLLLIDGDDTDDIVFDLKSIRLNDGKELDAIRHRGRVALRHEVQSQRLSLDVIAPAKRDGLVGLATAYPNDKSLANTPNGQQRTGQAFGVKMLQVDERTGAFKEVENGEILSSPATLPEGPMLGWPDTLITADIDGDQALERIEFYLPNHVKVRRGDTDELFNEFEIPKVGTVHRVEQIADKWYLVASVDNKEHQWIDLSSGKVALRFGQGLQSTSLGDTSYPRLLEHARGILLLGWTPEAPLCAQVNLGSKSANSSPLQSFKVAMITPKVDSRYRKTVIAHGLYSRKSLADVIRIAILTIGAILLPIGYSYRLIRRRQWSLQIMLLAPAITMLALVCWRALQGLQYGFLIPDIMAGLMATLSVWAVYTLMRHQHWKTLGISVALSMMVATLMMLGAQATIRQQTPGVVCYWTVGAWLSSVCAAAAQIVMPLALGIAWANDRAKRTGSIR